MFSRHNLVYALFALAAIGLINALYLAVSYYTGASLACSLLDGCNVVAASPYSKLFGIPLAYFGVLYFIGALSLGALMLVNAHIISKYAWAVFSYTVLGGMFSLYFEYLQLGPIGAICIYCQISAFTTWFLMLVAYMLWRRYVTDTHADISEGACGE